MLVQLDIHNVALIDHVTIELGRGLNVLTGETGAGKSIIIDSINAILGERLSKDLIRTGREKAVIEAIFNVDNERMADLFEKFGIEPEEDGTLILSREFSLSGKNVCRVNGKMYTVSMLRELGSHIIDVHGQHDNQSLLRTESHIELLDSFGGENIQFLKQNYSDLLVQYKNIRNKLRNMSGYENEREKKIDLLKYQINEIKKAKLKSGEEEELNKQRMRLTNAEKIINTLSSAYELIFTGNNIRNSASDNLNEALAELSSVCSMDENIDIITKRLEDLTYQLDDIIEDIRKERDNVEYNPELLEQIEERLDLIYKLKRKYGGTISDILEYCINAENELKEIIMSEEIINDLKKQLCNLNDKLLDAAKKINEERVKAAEILEERIGNELDDLEMKKAQFKVNIVFNGKYDSDSDNEIKYANNGLDKVEFLISPNTGEPLKSLSKIASGGEMSRIMLAIKTILANVDRIPTLIFDEIDIGISGKASQKVGEKLSYISKNHQVICVTHLAQIACMADNHYLIEKLSNENSTYTIVNKLDKAQVQDEICRILAGENVSKTTRKLAEEMISNAKKSKN